MKSKWYEYKSQAIVLRKKGTSLTVIHKELGIPKSTLSGWLKDVPLTDKYKLRLEKQKQQALIKARRIAVRWHNNEKEKRMKEAEQKAKNFLERIDVQEDVTLKLALALLYHGEGSKNNGGTSIGNSDPLVLRFFIAALQRLYNISTDSIRCELHLRADQNPEALVKHWSSKLGITEKQFYKPVVDKRTKGKPTYAHYKGVCVVRCSGVAIQRELMFISELFCAKIAGA